MNNKKRLLDEDELSQEECLKEIEILKRRISRLEGKERRYKQMEEALRISRNVFNSLHSLLISVNCEGEVTRWNTSVEKFTGMQFNNSAVRKEKVWDLIPFLEPFKHDFQEVIRTGRAVELRRQPVADRLDKRFFDISIYQLVYDREVKGAVIEIEDKTELVKKDRQLIQAQKMETVGNLAGGLAHDFNNVLGGITGAVSLMKYSCGKDRSGAFDKFESNIHIIEKSADRAAGMVKQLLTLSRNDEPALKSVNLCDSIRHIEKICRNTFDKSIELDFRKSVDGGIHGGAQGSVKGKVENHDVGEKDGMKALVTGDPVQIEQVLLNLCVNGAHAMTVMKPDGSPQGGTLTVSIQKTIPDAYLLIAHPEVAKSDYWLLEVKDTGVGMSPQVISRIFDPFFSTKGKGAGTGLGMTMVYNIVKQHNAFIEIHSEQGQGSVFRIYFPAREEQKKEGVPGVIENAIPGGTGVILLADDEDIMRETASAMLSKCGYDVIAVKNGAEALKVFKERSHGIDLVFLDMAMPKISGKEAFMRIKEIAPQVKVVLASGSNMEGRVEALFKMGVKGFIQKPYSLPTLAVKIREVIRTAS